MRLTKFAGYSAVSLLTAAMALGSLHLTQSAEAVWGRADNVGYYDGAQYVAGNQRFMFVDGIPTNYANTPTTANNFISGMRTYLYDQGTQAQREERAAARASVLINTMMGIDGTDTRYDADPTKARWENGVALAKQLFPQWEAIVRAYATPGNIYGGSVDFNFIDATIDGTMNGVGVGTLGGDGQAVPRGTAHGDYPDAVFAPRPAQTQPAIRFTHSGGASYTIQKWSGNITGNAVPFPQNWRHQANIVATTPDGPVTGGTVLNFTGTVTNVGTTPSGGGTMYGRMQANAQTPEDLRQASFGALNPGQSTGGMQFSYTVPSFAAAGTVYCVYVTVVPQDGRGGSHDSAKRCYTTGYASYPSIQGMNGDIHAGGGICGGTLSSGNIKGSSQGISMGEYVIAAAGQVNDIKSNGTGASNSLVMGSNGGYVRACRPNLLQRAVDGRPAGAAVISTNTINLGDISRPGMPDLYYYDGGGELSISGIVYSRITIVVTLGTVHIEGPVLLQSNTIQPSRSIASLGIISRSNITIDPAVTRVDGYLFSNESIDTCNPGATSGSTCATPELLVNGFLMGRTLQFNRLGRINTGGPQISERIILTPQLYLNPPKFFDEATKEVLQAQGEKAPLF